MIDKATREKIISLIRREVVPALGCTEPIAVSLAVARATELLGMQPEEINLGLSGNIIKNAMGVGHSGNRNDRVADCNRSWKSHRKIRIRSRGPQRSLSPSGRKRKGFH